MNIVSITGKLDSFDKKTFDAVMRKYAQKSATKIMSALDSGKPASFTFPDLRSARVFGRRLREAGLVVTVTGGSR